MSERSREPNSKAEKQDAWWGPDGAVGLADASEREREERIVAIAIIGYEKRRRPFRLFRRQADSEGGTR